MKFFMVVYLSVNGENKFSIITDEGLSAGIYGHESGVGETQT